MCVQLITEIQGKSDRTETGKNKIVFGGLNIPLLVIDRVSKHKKQSTGALNKTFILTLPS